MTFESDSSDRPDLLDQARLAIRHGNFAGAEQLLTTLLQRQSLEQCEGLGLLGQLELLRRRPVQARRHLEQALQMAPEDPHLRVNLGVAMLHLHRPEDAERLWLETLERFPGFAPALRNLARLALESGQIEQARAHYADWLAREPASWQARLGLASCREAEGRPDGAIAELQYVLGSEGEIADLHFKIAALHHQLGQNDQALLHYRRATELDAGHTLAHYGQAALLERLGESRAARQAYEPLIRLRPESSLLRLQREQIRPLVLADAAAADHVEAQLHETLDHFLESGLRFRREELMLYSSQSNWALVFQLRGSGRALREKFVRLFRPHLPRYEPLPNPGAPHLGFVVTAGHERIFARSCAHLLRRLAGGEIRLSVFCARKGFDEFIRPLLQGAPVAWQDLPTDVFLAAEQVRQARCDVLNFWEVGTDTQNFLLPSFRLAPVQTLSWGWAMTSGNPEVDYYISSRHLEIDGGEAHYTEKLLRLPLLPGYVARPRWSHKRLSRADFGLAEGTRLYACPQNALKLHPDFDWALEQILLRDPQGEILLLADAFPAVTQALQRRLRQSCASVFGRLRFVPRSAYDAYLSLLALSDLLIDPFHFSGANTTYDALSLGVPVLTLPGDCLRSRFTYAAHAQMGLDDCIACDREDYVQKALRLAQDKDYRRDVGQRILARGKVLYENEAVVDQHRTLFEKLIREARNK